MRFSLAAGWSFHDSKFLLFIGADWFSSTREVGRLRIISFLLDGKAEVLPRWLGGVRGTLGIWIGRGMPIASEVLG